MEFSAVPQAVDASGAESLDVETSPPSMSFARKVAAWIFSSAILALFDQCIVSGTRFATTMTIGRICGAEILGHYALAFGLIVALSIFLESVVTKPYTVFAFQFSATRRRVFGGSTLVQLAVTMAITACICSIAAVVLRLTYSTTPQFSSIAWGLAVALPGVLLWEFARRFAFAHLRMGAAVIIDTCVSALQLGGLVCIGWFDMLDVLRALMIVGLGGGIVGITSLYLSHSQFLIVPNRLWPDANRNWEFGRWMFAGQLIGLAQAYVVPVMLAYHFSALATGIIMACQTVVFLSNPFLIGIANWLSPVSAKLFATEGRKAVAKLTYKAIAIIGSLMIFYWLVLVFFGNEILTNLLGGEFSDSGNVVAIIGLAAISFGISVAAVCGLAAIDRPKIVLWGNGLGAVVAFASFLPFSRLMGLDGAAWSIATGSLAGALAHLLGFIYAAETSEPIALARLENVPIGSGERPE